MYPLLLSLHILFAIFWFGSVLFADFVVIPAIQATSTDAQNQLIAALGPRADRALIPAGALTILSGIAAGLASGVLGQMGTAYGKEWLAALVIALLTYLWAIFVITPVVHQRHAMAPDAPGVASQTERIKMLATLELLGFTTVFVLMMLMRFSA